MIHCRTLANDLPLLMLVMVLMTCGLAFAQENRPPVADFAFSPPEPRVGQEIIFSAVGSYDPDGTIQHYEWDFDDDGAIDASGPQVSHRFRSPGRYVVRLIVIDDKGLSASAIKPITVVGVAKNPWDYFLLEGLMGSVGAAAGGFGGLLMGFLLCPPWWEEPACAITWGVGMMIGSLVGAVTAVDMTGILVGVRGNIGRAYLTALGGQLISLLIGQLIAPGVIVEVSLIGFGAAFGYNIGAEPRSGKLAGLDNRMHYLQYAKDTQRVRYEVLQ